MKPKNFFLLLLVALIIPFVSAGTLISGSTMEVGSNYPGLDGLTLVGTWSTTPTVNDRVTINNLIIPEPYQMQSSADITFNRPTFEQVFEVRNQKRAFTIQYEERTFWFTPSLNSNTALQRCEDSWGEYRRDVENNKALVPGFDPILKSLRGSLGHCTIFWATMTQQGWYGEVFDDRIFYRQTINIQGVPQQLVLERSDQRDQLVATAPGVARVALMDFGIYTNARLSDNNAWAYHGRNDLGSDTWKPFSGDHPRNFEQALAAVIAHRNSALQSMPASDWSAWVQEFDRRAVVANNLATQFPSRSTTLPTQWQNNIVGTPRASGNSIIVEPRRDTFTANIQVTIRGESFGVFIPTGVCEIVSADQTVQWEEGKEGYLNYRVRNTGTDTASMRVAATCDGGNIQGFPEQFSLLAGQSANGRLTLTGQSVNFDPLQSFNCEFSCRESNTGQTATKEFNAVLERKELCTQGEELAPVIRGSDFVVDVLDSDCQVIQRKTCAVNTGVFERTGNTYQCVERTDIRSGDRPLIDDGDPGQFSPVILIIALLLGGVAGTLVWVWTSAIPKAVPKKSKLRGWMTALRAALAVGAFVLVVVLVALIIRAVIAAFTFTSLF